MFIFISSPRAKLQVSLWYELFYHLTVILTALLHADLIYVGYLMACVLIGHDDLALLNDVTNDAEPTQNQKLHHNR